MNSGTTRVIEGWLLIFLGLFALALSMSEGYSMYLNPRFAWLTASAGGAMVLFGLLRLTSRGSKGGLVRLLAIAAVLALAGLSDVPLQSPSAMATPEPAKPIKVAVEHNGVAYTKITTPELFYMVKGDKFQKEPGPYLTRGVVRLDPELSKQRRFYLVRLNIVCCYADAVGLGLVVEAPQGSELPTDGTWVRVFGELHTYKPNGKLKAAPPPEGKNTSLISQKAYMAATLVEATARPSSPYVFVLGAEQPYQY